jgi:hypothetical protein
MYETLRKVGLLRERLWRDRGEMVSATAGVLVRTLVPVSYSSCLDGFLERSCWEEDGEWRWKGAGSGQLLEKLGAIV